MDRATLVDRFYDRVETDQLLWPFYLLATRGHGIRALVRSGASDAEIAETVRAVWEGRADRYSEIRSAETIGLQKIEMSYVGG